MHQELYSGRNQETLDKDVSICVDCIHLVGFTTSDCNDHNNKIKAKKSKNLKDSMMVIHMSREVNYILLTS